MIVNLLTHPMGAGVGDICRTPPASSGHHGCPRLALPRGGGCEQHRARWAPRNSASGEQRASDRRGGKGARCDPAISLTLRLSATDILALASMKNVAKCDTWCELQNPVNHRVFERKLRPRLSGRGHACLGVTPRVAPRTLPPHRAGRCGCGCGYWPPVPCGAVGRSAGRRPGWTRRVVDGHARR